jgi:chromosome segregation ATPase
VIRYVREGKDKKLRICDRCDKKHIKQDLQENILNEINEIKDKIEIASETNSRLFNEKFDRTSRIHALEAAISKAEKEAKRKEEDLENRLKEEIDSNLKAKGRIDDYLKRLEEMKSTENELSEKISEEHLKLINLKAEKSQLDSKRLKLESEESDLRSKDNDLISIETLKKSACSLCKRKLESLSGARMSVSHN